MSKQKPTVEDVQKWADEARAEWLETHGSKEQVREHVHALLDTRLTDVVGQLLGFSSRWGHWELDHCNGRSGESAAGDYLREQAGTAVKEWLAKQAGNLPKLPVKAVQSLRREYVDAVTRELQRTIWSMAKSSAQQEAQRLFTLATGEDPALDEEEAA